VQDAAAIGLQGLLPSRSGSGGAISSITRNGTAVSFSLTTIKGIQYASFPASSGSYIATYAADTTPPTVTSTSPAAGATAVSVFAPVSATFSEGMDPATINTSTFLLRNAAGTTVPASMAYDAATLKATLTPTAPLTPSTTYTATIKGGTTDPRAKDLSGVALAADATWSFTTGASMNCPCSAFAANATTTSASVNDPSAVEAGVKFRSDVDGTITGIRFYKGTGNTGTHIGNVWTITGQRLATATFASETASGWQQVNFAQPVTITANSVYVASYFAPAGHYAADNNYFTTKGVDNPPIHLLQEGVSGGNGVFSYGTTSTFPTSSYLSSNYWVDVVFAAGSSSGGTDTTPPTVTATTPANGSTNVAVAAKVTATFSEAIAPTTVSGSTFQLRDAANALVASTVSYDSTSRTATLTPSASLAASTTYRATLVGGTTDPRIKDTAGNALAANVTWSFTTGASPTCPCSALAANVTPTTASANDSSAVELGVKFRSDGAGTITGIRFYKGTGNTGTHIGNLWTITGQRLATATFASETASGWQQVNFAQPVAITANTVYVASYFAPAGHYAADNDYFSTKGVDNPPIHLLQEGVSGSNGVFSYGTTSTFPTSSYQSTNYWVDVVFTAGSGGGGGGEGGGDTTPPTVTTTTPANAATNVATSAKVTATFSEAVDPTTVTTSTFQLRDAANALVASTVSYNSTSRTATLTPSAVLAASTTYRATVVGGTTDPRIKDTAGNALVANATWSFTTGQATTGICASPPNAVVAENCLPGNPASEWDVSGAGDTSIQGFTTDISVDRGGTVTFKVKTTASGYRFDIYRLGYYAGNGARKIATIQPSAGLPQSQPNCLNDAATGLIDCGNWSVSGSWTVPTTAVSGIYIARVVRSDTGGASHIPFIVRDDAGRSDLLFQTSDTTWQAYNNYGGNSLYQGGPGTNPGRAYKVSYNRPFNTRAVENGQDFLFNAEYPMVRWLEANGYDVSYTTGVDSERAGSLIRNHKVFMSVGHDEYWSGGQRANVEAARNAGVNIAFFSGNEIFWKTRWENSIDPSATAYRTLVSYKETHANARIDPADPPTATSTWLDPRFGPGGSISPTADAGRPGNSLAGTMYGVNDGATSAIAVPAADGKMRLWRGTSIATLATGTTATLPNGTLGYEWDMDVDNGSRPPGLVRNSTTTVSNAPMLQDYGSTYASSTPTHYVTFYRHASGARVFGAGTVQWSWGLDAQHDRAGTQSDVRMQQATVNVLADMNAQPAALQSGLVAATASTDTTPPASAITSPSGGAVVASGSTISISGTANDTGGGVVGAVEVSVDGGATWHPANGRANWTYTWTPAGSGNATISSRAADDSGNVETPSAGVTVTIGSATGGGGCPCTIWPASTTPANLSLPDGSAVNLGVRFRADQGGLITGVRFYKGTGNTGTHVGALWTDTGQQLAIATFTNESATGWQQVNFAQPVAITANTVYVASYFAPNGNYPADRPFFSTAGVDAPPLHALQDGVSGNNGVFTYASGTAFPTASYQASNYWVDVVFTPGMGADTTPPTVTATSPANGATGVPVGSTTSATFSETMNASTITTGTFDLRDASNAVIAATVTYNANTQTATLAPTSALTAGASYRATVHGGSTDPRVKDLAGNALAANMTWTFTTATGTTDTTPPTVTATSPPNGATNVAVGSAISASFSEAMNASTITTSTFQLLDPTNASVPATVSYNAETFTATLTPSAPLTAGASYRATLFGGTTDPRVKDVAGNALTANVMWTFATAPAVTDTTPPTITSVTPADGATGVNRNTKVIVRFSEPVDPASVNKNTFVLRTPSNQVVAGTVTLDSTGTIATFTPTSPLGSTRTFTSSVIGGAGGVKDVAGNPLASTKTWTFTTR